MKIGIITFHRAHNYGAVLQCFALSTTLKDLGHSVEVIDYYPSYFKKQYALFSLNHFSQLSMKSKCAYLCKCLITSVSKTKRRKKFNLFINQLPLTDSQYNEKNYVFKKYDAIIFGSDQIWNPLLTSKEDNIFCGNFSKNNSLFISYAASTSPGILNTSYSNYFKDIANRFDSISVREQSLVEYFHSIGAKSATLVLDPVLLLPQEKWKNIAIPSTKKNYLLIYTVPQNPKVRELAEMIAKQKKLEIIEIRPTVNLKPTKKSLDTVSPNEFLGYFSGASFVVTTSFHGTAFSIIFQKQFVTLQLGTAQDDRAQNLLNQLGLKDRLVDHTHLINPESDIDYKKIQKKLDALIKHSKSFITKSLKNEN